MTIAETYVEYPDIIGLHKLRKTWAYHQRKHFCVDIPTLMVIFNHSSKKQTLDYLCVQPQEIKEVYLNELLWFACRVRFLS